MPLTKEIIQAVEAWQQQVAELAAQQPAESRQLRTSEEQAQQLGERVAQLALQSLLDEGGKGYHGTHLICGCGGRLKYQRDEWRGVRTVVGKVEYRRAYYYCRGCGASRVPKDEAIGQGAREISAGVERRVAVVSAHLSFETSAKILREVGGIELSGRQCETVAEAIGAEAEQRTQAEAHQAEQQDVAPALRLVGGEGGWSRGRCWVVEMDGVQAPLQDGSWQEVKCGVIYELGQRVEVSRRRWELLRRERCLVRGPVAEFRARLWALLRRAGARVGERIVVLGDGSEWIDQTVAELFVGATRILDFYHVAERVWAVASVRYGEASASAQAWAREKLHQLKAGEVSEVCRAIKLLKLEEAQAQAVRGETLRYLEPRRAQMTYDQYQADGLPIGSGAVEGSCKYLVTARCKQAGMRWTTAGLDAILALRCWLLNERLDELCPKPKVKIEWERVA